MNERKISWWITSCYYPCWKHTHSEPAHYTLLEMLDVFSTCLVLEQSVAPTNSSPLVPLVVSSLPHRTSYPPPPFAGPSRGQWPTNVVRKNFRLSLLLRTVGWSPFRATRIKDNATAVAVVKMLMTPSSMNWQVMRFMNSSCVITLVLLSTFRDLRNRNIRNRYLQHIYKQWHVVSA